MFDLGRLVLTDPPAGVVGDPACGSAERTWSDPATAVPNLRRWSAQGREPELTQRVDRHRSAAEAEQSRRSRTWRSRSRGSSAEKR
ncbi:hypothetical protein [Micromonospora coriariae]|uniref:hypothetical protein n=1 Tax=Micromonospora coriariae TaxID=285665 RepID=UPI000B5AD61F|nr:hypothetical protein [Micromonospora coriariae]